MQTQQTTKPTDVATYISSFPAEVQERLNEIRQIIRDAAPEAIESISYGMPTYKQAGKPLVYFAAFKNHIGFYATPNGHEAFKEELSQYKQGKGSVQFPLNESLPVELIRRIAKYRTMGEID
ncbi:Uncharacterized conserved protein YdhG, YjbR/CyaY-like superfamily, DUF1801 family [Cnuella takakiae]|uniref:Uncharacterized conserved protein YdhG, YjbR/CyaY-like superfamily, DUF1801 family n=1 Tax=Cnuella takakiae TaxID=1302690 RepID=A0A1M5BVD5_9BACT|nr:DUF1801 domain-containing protein [Cnuella takakiae]OLY93521.1 hypothetical protein BUE76_17775 [Cnuella takakiae]SHF46192.1 Uncharacterized conserved protein YdhG, YjbR/CyaY-like superfamily, DUF1801 family [Cnuella takakiae]